MAADVRRSCRTCGEEIWPCGQCDFGEPHTPPGERYELCKGWEHAGSLEHHCPDSQMTVAEPRSASDLADLVTIGFTAARDLDDAGQEVILNVLITGVPHVGRYVTGGAIGGDAFIGRWLAERRPEAEHVIIVPADKSRVDSWWLEVDGTNITVIPMPRGSTYADRNAVIVRRSSAMFGFPAYLEDDPRSARSGSWQTIRMSRRAGNLSQWHCVKPPYRGRIEAYPSEFTRKAGITGG